MKPHKNKIILPHLYTSWTTLTWIVLISLVVFGYIKLDMWADTVYAEGNDCTEPGCRLVVGPEFTGASASQLGQPEVEKYSAEWYRAVNFVEDFRRQQKEKVRCLIEECK